MKPEDHSISLLKLPNQENVVNCDANLPQHYIIGVTIHKASYLTLQNASTFIEVSVDHQFIKHTASVDNSDTPFFNDYFVFEMDEPFGQLLKRTLRVAAFRKTCCAKKNECVGEFRIDIQTVWMMTGNISVFCFTI